MRTVIQYAAIALLFVLAQVEGFSQCSMCRAVIESDVSAEGTQVSSGINAGIVYLMGFPYLLIFGFLAYVFKDQLKGMVADLF
jgi:hypothetical protein